MSIIPRRENDPNRRALKAAQGKSMAPIGYVPDTETRAEVRSKAEEIMSVQPDSRTKYGIDPYARNNPATRKEAFSIAAEDAARTSSPTLRVGGQDSFTKGRDKRSWTLSNQDGTIKRDKLEKTVTIGQRFDKPDSVRKFEK